MDLRRQRRLVLRTIGLGMLWWLGAGTRHSEAASARAIQFNRDIRPILSEHCFGCHGPDEKQRKAKLRLDQREGAFARRDGVEIIVAGRRTQSELYRRLTTHEVEDRMPPEKAGKRLTAHQIELVGRWIDEGAHWQGHWAFLKPERPALPEVKQQTWPFNPIDFFILSRLEAEGLKPSLPASRETLARRVHFDLTGLPPTLEEIDQFLADRSPDAYGKLVDRLLDSPRFGERMAMHWLDLARFADTHGYHLDAGRDMSRWREWVIDAFNRNLPFDRFALEQVAGDLLPDASIAQRVATGFNRNNMINFEGGAIPEEYLTHYIVDRVNTTSTVFLGLTMGCAQCHDHKYDPLSMRDFYRLFAYFNAVPENGLDGRNGNAAPLVRVPEAWQQERWDQLESAVKEAENRREAARPAFLAGMNRWLEEQLPRVRQRWIVLDPAQLAATGGSTLARQDDRSFVAGGVNPDKEVYEAVARTDLGGIRAVRLEALPDDSLPGKGPGRHGNGSFVLSELELEAVGVRDPSQRVKVTWARAEADYSQKGFEVAKAVDGQAGTGWAIDAPQRHLPGTAWFVAETAFGFEGGTELRFRLRFEALGSHALGRARLAISAAADAGRSEAEWPGPIMAGADKPAEQRDAKEREALETFYLERGAPEFRVLNEHVVDSRKALDAWVKAIPTTMVMAQMDRPRETFMLTRGQYNQPGEKVTPGVPALIPPLVGEALPPNRLGLAQWLVHPDHPLVARVTVNRFWAMVFGGGLVKTLNDFGSRAEWPTHPDLLDWLATEFIRSGWDMKHVLRLLVTSATYQQSAVLPPLLREQDPDNRLYARGPRFRLSAEEIRDTALLAAGLLEDRIGGPSVFPYQPPGLWQELSQRKDSGNWTAQNFVQSRGPDLYRRSLYTFWKRTCPPPSLQTFDAPDRETCVVQRARTSTPLQSLVLLNDPTYVEAARLLAQRMMTQAGAKPAERVRLGFRLATARRPTAQEEGVLVDLYVKQLARFRAAPGEAKAFLSVGDYPQSDALDPVEQAAWASVAAAILNLDETINKG